MNPFKRLVTTAKRCKCGARLPDYPMYSENYEILNIHYEPFLGANTFLSNDIIVNVKMVKDLNIHCGVL